MERTYHNGIPCYHLHSQDEESEAAPSSEFTLLQDFSMPTRIQKIWESKDRNYIFLLGEYSSQVKCLDVHQMSMKYDRHLKDEALDGISLSDDYRKFAVLLRHRKEIEFHDPNGVYTKIRCSIQPNAMFLNEITTHVLLPSFESNIVPRLSLQDGKFHSSYHLSTGKSMIGAQAVCTLQEHNLDLIGCQDGHLRCFDPRASPSGDSNGLAPVSTVALPSAFSAGISSIGGDPRNSFHFAVGTTAGNILLYDLRKKNPFLVKDHCNDIPIKKIMYYQSAMAGITTDTSVSGVICSMDARCLHFWEKQEGATVTVVEPYNPSTRKGAKKSVFDYTYRASVPSSIHDFLCVSNHSGSTKSHSGLFLLGMEQSAGYGVFVPHLGTAPKWCAYLDKLATDTEKSKEKKEESTEEKIHKDFVFISQEEFDTLGITRADANLDIIRPMMNGYLIDHTHLRFLRQANEYQKPYQKATKASKLIKKLKKQDPITPVERVRRKKKSKSDIDERFADKMKQTPELYAQEDSADTQADSKRRAAYDSMFSEVKSLRPSRKGVQTMKLHKGADFFASDANIANAYREKHSAQ